MLLETHGPLCGIRPDAGAPARLVCFPHAGGGHAAFRRWPAALASTLEVWVAELPGRGLRANEPLGASWTATVTELADAVRGLRDGRPTVLLGHSLGALVAFETARRLEALGTAADHLVAAGALAPRRVGAHWRIPEDDDRLVAEVDRRYGAVPPTVRAEPELLRRFLPVLRADLELAAAYSFAPCAAPLACPVTALAGTGDSTATPEEAAWWGEHTAGDFRAVALPGGHFFLHERVAEVGALAAAHAGPAATAITTAPAPHGNGHHAVAPLGGVTRSPDAAPGSARTHPAEQPLRATDGVDSRSTSRSSRSDRTG